MHLCALRKSPVRFCVAILTHVFHVLLYKVFNEYFFETTKTYLIESASLYYCSRYQELLFFVLCVFTFSFLSFLDIHTLAKEFVYHVHTELNGNRILLNTIAAKQMQSFVSVFLT